MRHLFLFVVGLMSASLVSGQTFDKWDITAGGNSNPTAFTTFLGKLYFKATNPSAGSEMWLYDTVIVPTMLPELLPGTGSGHGAGTGSGYIADGPMAEISNQLYYAGDDGASGIELYQYDGFNTPLLAYDIVQGMGSSSPRYLTVLGSKLYFSASDTDGHELWSYDPALDTAIKLADINPGAPSSNPRALTVFNGKIYFTATAIATGQELYVYDPTGNTVSIVADIYPSGGSGNVQNLVVHNGKLYFSANDPAYGQELFVYDGATVNRLTDINPGPLSSLFTTGRGGMAVLNDKLVFFAQSNGASNDFKLYTYDILGATPSLAFADIKPALNTFFTHYHSRLFFAALHDTTGAELYSYDGNTVSLMLDIAKGATGSSPAEFTVFKDWLYFSANDPSFGLELFRYNDQVVGIENVAFDGALSVYPNPAINEVNFGLRLTKTEELEIAIVNMNGQTVYSKKQLFSAGANIERVSLSALPAGWYIYQVLNGQGRVYAKGKLAKQ